MNADVKTVSFSKSADAAMLAAVYGQDDKPRIWCPCCTGSTSWRFGR